MLLRSSSTPVLGSLLSSFSDSPNDTNYYNTPKHYSIFNRSPFHQTPGGCLHLTNNVSCNSSPLSPSISDFSKSSLRRAQSEGNLEGLALNYGSCSSTNENLSQPHKNSSSSNNNKVSGRQKCLLLETIPSFSLCNSRACCEEEEEEEEEEDCDGSGEIAEKEETTGNLAIEGGSFGPSNVVLNEQLGVVNRSFNMGYFEEEKGLVSEEMYLARGLGIDGGSSGGTGGGDGGGGGNGSGGELHWTGGEGGDKHGTEEYYKKMVQENPGNPLFLRNYAQFLYQSKQDLKGAEEYYSRAILADPKDGEILSQYAKLVWKLHNDQDRASTYFERAVQASPEDSHVHAAYASFLWETEEDDDECVQNDFQPTPPHFHGGAVASTGA